MRMRRERSAGAIIFRREEKNIFYLILHYSSGHWEFAKGHIEEGENEKETVVRETKEETGIGDLFFCEGFREEIKYFFKSKRKGLKDEKPILVSKEVIFYLAETKTKDVIISKEHRGFDWLPYKEALERVTFKGSKSLLRKANDFISQIR
jgi:bis(5'-nucleosidyl)-tetraphosphatase